jgi:hypothetical protein
MIPDFMVNKIVMSTLLVDKSVNIQPFNVRFAMLPDCIRDYFASIETGFVSDKSKEFKAYLEDRVGKIEFSKSFAVRVRPGSYRMFIGGKEIFR